MAVGNDAVAYLAAGADLVQLLIDTKNDSAFFFQQFANERIDGRIITFLH